MKALSIRQPWAWLILNAGKDIENRSWYTSVRGRVLIHASKGMTLAEYEDAIDTSYIIDKTFGELPPFAVLDRGGIIGSVELVDCVKASKSRWFFGPYGFVLRNPVPLPFRPLRGQLGFFEVPDNGEFK